MDETNASNGEEWFRRSSWSEADRADFSTRLRDTRTSALRAHRLRTQAWHLQACETKTMCEAALELLDQLLQECPEPSELATAHQQRAECLVCVDLPVQALDAYRASIAAERIYPEIRGLAYLGFAELVLTLGDHQAYREAIGVLDEFCGDALLPTHVYRCCVACAFLHEALGQAEEARVCATGALQAAGQTEDDFPEYGLIGLVRDPDPAVQAAMRRLRDLP